MKYDIYNEDFIWGFHIDFYLERGDLENVLLMKWRRLAHG